MDGMQVDSLRMDPYWNQYWQESMMLNTVQQQDSLARQQAYLAQQQTGNGTNTTSLTFEANPEAASATANIQTMQEGTSKKGNGGKIVGGLLLTGLGIATIIANNRGKGNIIEGFKDIFNTAKNYFVKTKTINGKKVKIDHKKLNRLKTEADVLAIGGKTDAFDLKNTNSKIQAFTSELDGITFTARKGEIVKSIKGGKKYELSSDETKKIKDFIKTIDDKNTDNIAKISKIEYAHTEDGITRIFRANTPTETPVFTYGTSHFFPETTS